MTGTTKGAGDIDGGEALDGFIDALLEDDAAQLYDRAPCGYLSTTPDGTVIKANQTFLTMVGYERGDVVGRLRFSDLLSVGGRIYYETHYAPMLSMQGVAREIALECVCRDGERLPVLVNSVLERDAAGAPRVVRTAVFDARDRRQYERELLLAKERAEASEARATALAQTLQLTLLPPSDPAIPGLDVAARYRPAGEGAEVGGDFYDVFQAEDGDWVIILGDVRGKGVAAAVVTALARYTLRAAAMESPSPAHALSVLDHVLARSDTDRHVTAVCLRLARTDHGWRCSLSCGGHPPPLLCRAGELPRPVGRPGSLIGVLDTATFTDDAVSLSRGDLVVAYTDGVSEGRRGRQFYGEERISAVLGVARGSAGAAVSALVDDVVAFQAGLPRDDIAVLAVRVPDPKSS